MKPSNLIRTRRRIGAALAFVAGLAVMAGLNGCLTVEETVPRIPDAFVFAVTSDYKSGSYSISGLDEAFSLNDIAPVGSDVAVRWDGGNDIFVINRYGRDNIQVVDRHNLKTVLQIKLDALSNPQDVALKDSLLYIAQLGSAKIAIKREGDGSDAGSIDLSAYADTVDHLPETEQVLFIGNDLYAILQNMNSTLPIWQPLTARLVKIDVSAKKVSKALDLPFGNPLSMAYDSAAGKLYIPCAGAVLNDDYTTKLDGGLISVNLSSWAVAETLATEASLKAGLNRALFHDGKLYLDLSSTEDTATADHIVAMGVADKKIGDIAKLKAYDNGGMGIDAATSTLYIGDRSHGLRAFDLNGYKEKSPSNVSLGKLPAADIAVIR